MGFECGLESIFGARRQKPLHRQPTDGTFKNGATRGTETVGMVAGLKVGEGDEETHRV